MNQRTVQFNPHLTSSSPADANPVAVPADASLTEKVIAVLRNIYDPEIPVNIYDLGLIYSIDVVDAVNVNINMTLTSPHCPVAESLPAQVQCAVQSLDAVQEVCVQLVWDPPWDQGRMSEDAKLLLDMY